MGGIDNKGIILKIENIIQALQRKLDGAKVKAKYGHYKSCIECELYEVVISMLEQLKREIQ